MDNLIELTLNLSLFFLEVLSVSGYVMVNEVPSLINSFLYENEYYHLISWN